MFAPEDIQEMIYNNAIKPIGAKIIFGLQRNDFSLWTNGQKHDLQSNFFVCLDTLASSYNHTFSCVFRVVFWVFFMKSKRSCSQIIRYRKNPQGKNRIRRRHSKGLKTRTSVHFGMRQILSNIYQQYSCHPFE